MIRTFGSAHRLLKAVTTSLLSIGSGIGVGLLVMLAVQGHRLDLSRVIANAEAAPLSDAETPATTAPKTLNQMTFKAELAQAGVTLGAPIYLRIFKSNGRDGAHRTVAGVQGAWDKVLIPNWKRAWVELWVQGKETGYRFFKSYPVCTYTGSLGPKREAEDKQAPEGFYTIQSAGMNPNSMYHRAMDIGYPNAYDRLQRATGSQIKIHGMCISGGCFTMGEPQNEDHQQMEELYTIVKAAHAEGQTQVPVHIFPFPMTEENMTLHANSQWIRFWTMLKPAYDLFEREQLPPQVRVINGEYVTTSGVLERYRQGRERVNGLAHSTEQAMLLQKQGDLPAAMALLKDQEQMYRELGAKAGLAAVLGDQAAILQQQGNLAGAMALLKDQERLYRELGAKAKLASVFGNQATLLQKQGDPAGAMALYQAQERLCRDLGSTDGLATALANQARLLAQEMGRPREALPLAEEAYGLATNHGFATLALRLKSTLETVRSSAEHGLMAANGHELVGASLAAADYTARLNQYEQDLARWHTKPWWKRLFSKKPKPPAEI